MARSLEFEGKTVLVTGGSSGIGRATCLAFAMQGAHVLVHYFRGAERAQSVVSEIESQGATATAVQGNLTDGGDRARLIDEIRNAVGHLDVLVNNAGDPLRRASFSEVDETLLEQTINVNFKGPFLLTQGLLPLLCEQGGVIVNVSTALTRRSGSGGNLHYASVKGAINVLTAGLAVELAPMGIRVNCVAPGAVDTELQQRLSTPERLQRTASQPLLKRLGKPDEIADVILFLASRCSAYMTGQLIFVDGG